MLLDVSSCIRNASVDSISSTEGDSQLSSIFLDVEFVLLDSLFCVPDADDDGLFVTSLMLPWSIDGFVAVAFVFATATTVVFGSFSGPRLPLVDNCESRHSSRAWK